MTYTSLTRTRPLTVVETETFVRQAAGVWSDEERAEFIDHIARRPDAGVVIPDTGGLRKVRWGRQGSGKRGGVRVVYFYHDLERPLYLLLIYAKAQREDMTPAQRQAAKALVAQLKQQGLH
jgi:hypothetical protein